jgi:hypothetical protein
VGQVLAGIETVNAMMRADRDSLRRLLFARPLLNFWLSTTITCTTTTGRWNLVLESSKS